MDQTQFSQTQEVIQAPPQEPPNPRIQKIKKIGFQFLIVFVIVLAVGFGATQVHKEITKPKPTPAPPSIIIDAPDKTEKQSEFSKKLQEFNTKLSDFEPGDIEIKPPVLNFSIRI